ncbi:hypothetical protein [Neosynechococcus sphagnicola]|uniref:hypothetical protein n=1 Tax=Neosynechococcus sphagnicola TaxID=1501145 RepID=UPI0009077175|nr:hypothetical protein [Neosynechococcus sphagnicola]
MPQPVFQEGSYSPQFERCWQQLQTPAGRDAYLDGTAETIYELLTPAWDISACARCAMPVPIINRGMSSLICPCNNLPTWPNTELPPPRQAITNQDQLAAIRSRLLHPRPSVEEGELQSHPDPLPDR